MKILHIIDEAYFETHNRIIEELLLALYSEGVEQRVYTSAGADLAGVTSGKFPVSYWKVKRNGNVRTFTNKIRTMMLLSSFAPNIVIKWGLNARMIAWGCGGVQVSYLNERESLVNFENTDYIMTNSDDVLEFVKARGFSGSRSFILPPMVYEYKTGKNVKPLEKRDFFIPEKAKILYTACTFSRNVKVENAFEVLGTVSDKYFFIAGHGPDKEYIEDWALRFNVKARARFIADTTRNVEALKMSEFAFLPFEEAQSHKYILEAMMAGVLVVTVKTPETEEIITDGVSGFFIPKRDMYLIKKKFKEILNMDEAERAKIASVGQNVAKQYAKDFVIGAYLQTFSDLVKRYDSRRNLLD